MLTLVCQIVKEVAVITAKRWPVLDILSAKRGSFPAESDAELKEEDSGPGKRADGRR